MEKATAFGLPFVYRVILPGSVATILLLPLLAPILRAFGVASADLSVSIVAVIVLFGLVLAALDDPIYEVFEGRALWPNWFYALRRNRWQRRVDQLVIREAILPDGDWRKAECWNQLRRFPTDLAGRFYAARPTLLGNVLASYEQYPDRVYGMHPVAFWQRLWLRLDKDVRDELDRLWAPSDGLVYTAAALIVVGATYVLAALVSAGLAWAGVPTFFDTDERWVAFYVGLLIAFVSLVPYRVSIGGHMDNGDAMKAAFDVFRDRLEGIEVPASPAVRARNSRLGQWLTYGDGDAESQLSPNHARGLFERVAAAFGNRGHR